MVFKPHNWQVKSRQDRCPHFTDEETEVRREVLLKVTRRSDGEREEEKVQNSKGLYLNVGSFYRTELSLKHKDTQQ